MKKITFFFLLGAVSFSFSQQSDNQITQQKISKYSLNLAFFETDTPGLIENSLSALTHEVDVLREKSIDDMLIFNPEGKFFLKIYKVEPDIDEKMNIHALEKSRHFWKTVG